MGLYEEVSGLDAAPDGDLAQALSLVLHPGEDGVYAVVHEQATVDLKVASGAGAGETELALTVDGEAGVVPVASCRGGWDGFSDIGLMYASRLLEMTLQDVPLHFKLAGVGYVLPLATSALAEVGARGLDAVGGGVDDAGKSDGLWKPFLPSIELDLYGLAGDGEGAREGTRHLGRRETSPSGERESGVRVTVDMGKAYIGRGDIARRGVFDMGEGGLGIWAAVSRVQDLP